MDDALGSRSDQPTISDLNVDKLNAIPVEAIPRNIDIPIIEADKVGYVKAYLIAPGAVFGLPSGPLVDLGIQKTSSALSIFIRPALARKQGGYIGKGLNKWCAVDVEDTADLYRVIFDTIRSNPDVAGHGPEGYYFAGNTEFSGLEIGRAISEALADLAVGTSRKPRALSQEEFEAFCPMTVDLSIYPDLALFFWHHLDSLFGGHDRRNSLFKADRGVPLAGIPNKARQNSLQV